MMIESPKPRAGTPFGTNSVSAVRRPSVGVKPEGEFHAAGLPLRMRSELHRRNRRSPGVSIKMTLAIIAVGRPIGEGDVFEAKMVMSVLAFRRVGIEEVASCWTY